MALGSFLWGVRRLLVGLGVKWIFSSSHAKRKKSSYGSALPSARVWLPAAVPSLASPGKSAERLDGQNRRLMSSAAGGQVLLTCGLVIKLE